MLLRTLFSAVLTTALFACGGGGSGTATDEPGVPITSTTQALDASGGSVTLQGLSLVVPVAALSASTELGLQQETASSPALARFRFSPAGQTLEQAAELRYGAAGLPPNVRFFWEVDGQRWMIPGTVSGGVLSSKVTSLGYNAAGSVPRVQAATLTERMTSAATRVRAKAAATDAGGSLVVAPVDCDSHVAELSIRLRRVATEGDQERAAGIFNDLVATKEACASARIQELERASCDALAQAQSNATVLLADNLNTFRSLTVPLVAAQGLVEVTGATCSNANPAANPALMEAKFDQLLDVMKGQMARAQFTDDLTVRDLDLIMYMDETFCQKVNLGSVCDRLTNELYPDLLDALRSSAFEACRNNGTPLAVSQLYALGSRAGDADKFYSHGRFSLASVESDLNYCSNPSLGLRVFDGEAVPGELTDRATTLRPLVAPGNYQKTRVIEVPRDGSLNIAGTVGVLRCPDGSASRADLVVRINGQEWVRRAASGNAYPLESAPLLLDLAKVLPGFGIDLVTHSGFTVLVNREGGACSDGKQAVLEDPFTLFRVNVTPPESVVFRGTLVFSQAASSTEAVDMPRSASTRTGTTNFSADVELVGTTRLNFTRLSARTEAMSRSSNSAQKGLPGDFCRYIGTTTSQERITGVSNSANEQDFAAFSLNVAAGTWSLENLVFKAKVTGVSSSSTSYTNTANCEGFDFTDTSFESPYDPSEENININFFDNTSPSGYVSGTITRNPGGRRSIQYSGSFRNTSNGVTTTTTLTLNLNEVQ